MGRPKKVKRAYHRKAVQQTDEKLEPSLTVEEAAENEELADKLVDGVKKPKEQAVNLNHKPLMLNPEMMIEVKVEESGPVKPVKPKQMFHILAVEQIELEEKERLKKEAAKKHEQEEIEKAKKDIAHQPKLVCHFCQHVQYSLNSKDPTSAWCEVCGRCFQAVWQ